MAMKLLPRKQLRFLLLQVLLLLLPQMCQVLGTAGQWSRQGHAPAELSAPISSACSVLQPPLPTH